MIPLYIIFLVISQLIEKYNRIDDTEVTKKITNIKINAEIHIEI